MLSLLFALGTAGAQELTIHIDEELAASMGIDSETVESRLQNQVVGELRVPDQAVFVEQMTRAAMISGKGMGVDYASNPQRFVVGGSIGSGANGVGASLGAGDGLLPAGGLAFQAAAMAGVNLGLAAPEDSPARRFVLYGNAMVASGTREPWTTSLANGGGHLQIKLVKPQGTKVMRWGGFDLTTGYEYSRYSMALEQPLQFTRNGVTWDATGNFEITGTGSSIPLELSTNLKLTAVGVFCGAALDINAGSGATSGGTLGGDIIARRDGVEATIGDAVLSMDTEGSADPAVPRFFGGFQFHIAVVKLYGHVNIGLDESFGAHTGLRVAM